MRKGNRTHKLPFNEQIRQTGCLTNIAGFQNEVCVVAASRAQASWVKIYSLFLFLK